jgi:hypothetical protein
LKSCEELGPVRLPASLPWLYVVRHQQAHFSDRLEKIYEILETMNYTMFGATDKTVVSLEEVSTTLGDIDITIQTLPKNLGVDSG